MSARTNFKKQFRVNGIRLTASVHQKADGTWKIVSVGAVDIPTPLLPFEIQSVAMDLVRREPFATDNQAKAALLDAGAGQ
jgi:hypothetical protein